jgi:cobyrinic acid a,c-diamide synthase
VVSVPRLVVAAPASGGGKTTVATGLMAAFTARGLRVSPHKVGPDYIDPGYHALATGRPGRNLDPWLTGEDLIAPLFAHGAHAADLAIVEGVMGLYDGAAGHGDFASTAHVARLLSAPVVLVVDAASAGRSVAALVHGFVTYGSLGGGQGPHIGGVILNRIGSDRHAEICRTAVEDLGLPVLGVICRTPGIETPSRHLGLIPAAERRPDALATVDRLAALTAESCDLEALEALARTAPPLTTPTWDPATTAATPTTAALRAGGPVALSAGGAALGGGRPVVGVAGGAAFTFSYAENVELLAAAGAEVVVFDPLRDEALPEGVGGLVIGGGFPEMYAAELSANEALRTAVGRWSGPVYAECAGLLYLTKALDGLPMCGLLEATATMTPRLTLGYRQAVAVADSVLARAGERVSGHEFHRTAVTPARAGTGAWQWDRTGPEGFVQNGLLASYLHLHWAGRPEMARRFVEASCG